MDEKLFDYIVLLEKTNKDLLNTLKQCMVLLKECRPCKEMGDGAK